MGIHQTNISKLESGTANPSLRTRKRLAAGMGMKFKLEFVPAQSEFCVREALIISAAVDSERFFVKSRFGKRRNTVCISRFSNRRIGGKDPSSAVGDLIRGSLDNHTPLHPAGRPCLSSDARRFLCKHGKNTHSSPDSKYSEPGLLLPGR